MSAREDLKQYEHRSENKLKEHAPGERWAGLQRDADSVLGRADADSSGKEGGGRVQCYSKAVAREPDDKCGSRRAENPDAAASFE